MWYASWNPYPISDQDLWFSLPYFRPDQKSDTLFQTWSPRARRVTRARDKLLRALKGTWSYRQMIKKWLILLKNIPNGLLTQFKTRVHKPYPISMFVLYVFWGRRSFIDPICRYFLHGFVHVFKVGFGQLFIFSARHQLDTWTLAPQKTRGMAWFCGCWGF